MIYEIPLSCDRCYVGQTGRCLNDRLREHAYAIKTGTGSTLAAHVSSCNACKSRSPDFGRCKVLKHYRDQRRREIYEAFIIHKRGIKCVSTPSVALTEKEIRAIFFSLHSCRFVQVRAEECRAGLLI